MTKTRDDKAGFRLFAPSFQTNQQSLLHL